MIETFTPEQIKRWQNLENSYYNPDFQQAWNGAKEYSEEKKKYMILVNKLYLACVPFISPREVSVVPIEHVSDNVILHVQQALKHAGILVPQGFLSESMVNNRYMKSYEDIRSRVLMASIFSEELVYYLIYMLRKRADTGFSYKAPAESFESLKYKHPLLTNTYTRKLETFLIIKKAMPVEESVLEDRDIPRLLAMDAW